MADYKKMYMELFNKLTVVIKELQEVQRQTERMYIESAEPKVIVLLPEAHTDSDHKD